MRWLLCSSGVFIATAVSTDTRRCAGSPPWPCTAKLREASAAKDAKVSGVFTLSLNISVLKGHADVVVDITTKEPRAKGRELSLWVTKGGNLSTDAPVQKKLPLEGLAGGQSKGANEESEGGEYRINISKAKEV